MKPLRLLAGIAATIAVITFTFGQPPETVTLPAQAPNTVIVTLPPTTLGTTTTTQTPAVSTTKPQVTTTMPKRALLPADHVCAEWLPTMLEAGWPVNPDILAMALTIGWRESRCQANADSGPDHGIWQINRYWCNPSKYTPNGWLQDRGIVTTCDDLFDPLTNARAALAIYLYSVDRNGDGFLPWTTYSARP